MVVPLVSGSFDLDGPAGRIECLLRLPPGAARGAAVVCHPHPLYGGTLHNKVVHHAARALVGAGLAALRFNFRGVGRSEGKHDRGEGEGADLRFLVDWLAVRFPAQPLLVAGYSFGAWVALRTGAPDPRVSALVGLGLATTFHDFGPALVATAPTLLVQGDRDELGPIVGVRALAERFAAPVRLVEIAGADHFFSTGLEVLEEDLHRFASERLG